MLAFSTTTGIALYAALVATGGLAVQLVKEWRTWGSRVTVSVRPMMLHTPGALTGEAEPVVLFKIVNHSDHPVKVTSLWVEPIRDDGKSILFPWPLPQPTPGPYEVPAHDSIDLYQPRDSFSDGELDRKTRAGVGISTGKTFKSKRVRVGSLMES